MPNSGSSYENVKEPCSSTTPLGGITPPTNGNVANLGPKTDKITIEIEKKTQSGGY